jgi:soluble lytic murein transglycosylase
MSKALKNTIAIVIIIIVSVSLGYAYDRIITAIEKRSHPIRYEEFVERYSREYNVPQYIIFSVIKAESSFNSNAVSHAGAVGLMQITPDTFDWLTNYRLRENLAQGLLYDPETNIKYGTFFLSYLYREFGSWDISFAAYNAGMNRVKNNWMHNPEIIKDNEIVYIPIEETRNYVQRVNRNIEVYRRLYFN